MQRNHVLLCIDSGEKNLFFYESSCWYQFFVLRRSTRPIKKLSQDTNDSQSSGEDDDEDGFEILTAENLFSTLLQRVSLVLVLYGEKFNFSTI